ncbi:MAG: CehA/McbA family metallohydrolase [Chloroflexi bacterium]|nr:CehA/McbA family metallohydrolase [Chloroflexota bacterium]
MAFDHREPYVTDVEDYNGPLDRVSPYHYYMFTYWRLRGHWRNVLYAWTRRPPCDATAAIAPAIAVADVPTTLTITVTIGETPLGAGGRVAVYCQKDYGGTANHNVGRLFQGPDGQAGYGARITASASRPEVGLRVRVHCCGAVFTCAEVFVESGELGLGDTLSIVLGDPSCKPPVVCEKAKTLPFRVGIDYRGDGEFRPIADTPTVRVVGGRAAYLRCFAPATPAPGEPIAVRVVAADLANHNPAYQHHGRLRLSVVGEAASQDRIVEMPEEAHGAMLVQGLAAPRSGVTRIRVIDERNGLMGQTNPICPEMAPPGLRVYYGEIHSHTELSDGTGSCDDNYTWARDVEGLDFAALADHFEDGQSYNYVLADKWRLTQEATERFHAPGRFVTLLGYEIGTLEAHRNVYFRDGVGRMIVEGPEGERVTMDNVYDKLEGAEYILIPHAPKYHGINWRRPHRPDRQRLVEICSSWGISEEGGEGRYQSVRHALEMGYRFGFTGGTDNHSAEPGNPDLGGITGVLAPALTREALFDALLARHTFATSGPRMTLRFEGHGAIMGDELVLPGDAHPRFRARALAGEAIARLELIGNGQVVHAVSPEDTDDATLEWEDERTVAEVAAPRELGAPSAYYYLRVTTVNGAYGWSSPIWVSQA